MILGHIESIRDAAASETLQRIRADHDRVSWKIKPLLKYIEQHLFDPDLNLNRLRRALDIRTNALMSVFRREVGLPPKAYIVDCRMEVATRLLRDTDLRVWQIGDLIGYSALPVFSQAFTGWSGLPPTKFRERSRSPEAQTCPDRWQTSSFLRKVLSGEAEEEEIDPLLCHLRTLYPDSPGLSLSDASNIQQLPDTRKVIGTDGIRHEELRAESVWDHICDWPIEEQRRYVRSKVSFGSRALFDLLREKSREIGRQNRKRGVEVAELALESLEGSSRRLGRELPNLLAQGWAWVGNARRLAADHLGAEQALLTAEESWHRPRVAYDYMVRAEILGIKSSQRLFQGEFPEALELVDRALTILRRGDDPIMLTNFLIQRAMILVSLGNSQTAFSSLDEAHSVLKGHPDQTRLLLSTHSISARILAEVGRYRPAFEALWKAEILLQDLGDRLIENQLIWVEGIIRSGMDEPEQAEQLFFSAREGFMQESSGGHAAMVALDLALLYQRQNRAEDVIAAVATVIPIVEGLHSQKQTLGTLQLLRQAVKDKTVTTSFLEDVRRVCFRCTLQ